MVEENQKAWAEGAIASDRIVAAWGTHGSLGSTETGPRSIVLAPWSHKLHCLRLTNDGHPQHPLYVAAEEPEVSTMTAPRRFDLVRSAAVHAGHRA